LFDYQFKRANDATQHDVEKLSLAELQSRVASEYPELELNNSDANNRRRLEQILRQGPANLEDRKTQKIDSLVLGMDVKKPLLKQNIALRTKSMLNNGFIQEVKNLTSKNSSDCELFQTTGYREVVDFIRGNIDKNELEAAINHATYQLARKQNTWFSRNKNILWIDTYAQAEAAVSDYCKL